MDSKVIVYFLSVSRHLSFTKAAQECAVAQSAISQQIDKLEKELGFRLFQRSNRSVTMTQAGKAFAEDMGRIVEESALATSRARRIAEGREGKLHISLLGQYEYNVMRDAFQAFRQEYPDVEIVITNTSFIAMEKQLFSGEIDIAIGSLSEFSGVPGILCEKIYSDKICVLMSRDMPLASRISLRAEDLRDQPFIFVHADFAPNLRRRMIADNRVFGYEPRIVKEANTFESMLLMVDAGLGIALFPEGIRPALGPHTVIIPLEGSPMAHDLAIARLEKIVNPASARFFSLAHACFSN